MRQGSLPLRPITPFSAIATTNATIMCDGSRGSDRRGHGTSCDGPGRGGKAGDRGFLSIQAKEPGAYQGLSQCSATSTSSTEPMNAASRELVLAEHDRRLAGGAERMRGAFEIELGCLEAGMHEKAPAKVAAP